MSSTDKADKGSRPVRMAVIAAALSVAVCFGLAVSLAGVPAAAEQATQTR